MKSMIKHGYAHTNSAIIDFPQENSNKHLKIFDAKLRVGDDFLRFKNKKLSIKIDVEGHELSTLRGLVNNLNQNKCLILIEIGKEKFNEVNNFLNRNNFIKIFKSKHRLDYVYTNFNSLNN